MTIQWRAPYDRYGNAEIYAGETVILDLELQQPDGNAWVPQSLTGRVFVQRVIDDAGQTIAEALGEIITPASGAPYVRFVIPGDGAGGTGAMLVDGQTCASLRHEIAEIIADGRDVFTVGDFQVCLSVDPQASQPSAGSGSSAPAARYVVQQGPKGSVVVRYAGAPGRGLRTPRIISANYTATDGDSLVLDSSAGGFTVMLPEPGGLVLISSVGDCLTTSAVTLNGNGKTIDGATTLALDGDAAGYLLQFTSEAAVWRYTLNYQHGAA